MFKRLITLTVLSLATASGIAHAADGEAAAAPQKTFEGALDAFMGEPKQTVQQVFEGDRFPNVTVAVDGSVLAVWNGVKLRRSEDGGETWGKEIEIGKGFMGGGVTVNESNGVVFAFASQGHPPSPDTVYKSEDHGKSWAVAQVEIKPDSKGHKPEMHMNEHGITLRHGKHKGRLIRPSRYYGKVNERAEWPIHYTSAIYSDDGGKTWLTSEPFPEMGTGEAAIAELANGQIYYNSRRHWAPKGKNPRRRWASSSDDGGVTWKKATLCRDLPDGSQNTDYGCMAGLVRLPIAGKNVLLYSNCDSLEGRKQGTIWASFDNGRSWPLRRLLYAGSFAYSSLDAGRPGTPSEGWIYCMFESDGAKVARFNLSWLLEGQDLSKLRLPKWIAPKKDK
ncbi:MAG: sialidase family protein [Kiritimatiellae bacterium]|nr:sialidase family protein [Kiritimatiellia bacterium]